jgi:hypothetical protein
MGRGRVVAVGGEEGDGFALGGLGECQPVRLFFFHRQAGFFFGVVVVLVGCKVEREIVLFFLPSFLLYFFSTLTFWLSQERPSKIPRGVSSVLLLFKELFLVFVFWIANLTFSAGGATGLDLPHVVLGYSVEVEGLGYVVWSHCCKKRSVSSLFSSERDMD